MTPLESKITALLNECENILEPSYLTKQKWVIVSETSKQLNAFFDEKHSLSHSYIKAISKIQSTPEFNDAKNVLNRDSVFKDAVSTAGYWVTFDAIIQHLITSAGSIKKDEVVIDCTKAISTLREYRKVLQKKSLKYVATARLLGVKQTAKLYELTDGITLRRLTRQELNDRQPTLETYYSTGWEEQQLTDHSSELSVSISIPIDHKQDGAFFKAKNDAKDVAQQMFNKVVDSILVAMTGRTKLSSIDISGGIEQIPIGRSISQEMPPHINVTLRKNDFSKIIPAYELVSGGKTSDKVLSRSLHRFLLGRKRTDVVDKLVDYVIAWEALLLTNNGNAVTQELSYRFSLNGASLISCTSIKKSPNEALRKMKGAYSARSTIVHGGSESEINKVLKVGDYNNTPELCDYLETNYRNVIYYLLELEPKERPYLKQSGWELLLWPTD